MEGFNTPTSTWIYETPGESDVTTCAYSGRRGAGRCDHVRVCLVVEHGTALASPWARRGELAAPDDDVLAHRYELVDALAVGAGWSA